MKVNEALLFEMSDLVIKGCDNSLNDDEFNRLQHLLKTDPVAVEYYCDLISTFANMDVLKELCIDTREKNFNSLFEQLAEHEINAPAIEIPKEKPEKLPVEMLKIERLPRRVNKFSLYSAIVSIAALIVVLVYVQIVPQRASSVAAISDSINAQWELSKHPTDIGSRLWNNEGARLLKKGAVKIAFDYGAEVIIEGPAEFEMKDAEKMILHFGRLYAVVPKEAAGFTVDTPFSTVIDLGTEFGVKVDIDGVTDVHMFKGRVSLIPGAKGKKSGKHELTAGQASRVDTSGQIHNISFERNNFVRKIQSGHQSTETSNSVASTSENTFGLAPNAAGGVVGKWYGYREDEWGQVMELLVKIAHNEKDRYHITLYESAEEYAPVALEIGCTLADPNVLIFDSSEMIDEGKGVIANGLLKGSFQGSENGKFVLHTVCEKSTAKLAGKWQGERRTEDGQQESISINVTDIGNDQYRFDVLESFEPDNKVLFSLNGTMNKMGQITFSGQTELWTGTGKGFCGKEAWSGTLEGDESGHYMLRRVKR